MYIIRIFDVYILLLFMTIKKGKVRKEVHLTNAVLKKLQLKADKEGRSLKNWMEHILNTSVV
jgi:hypothetical protein